MSSPVKNQIGAIFIPVKDIQSSRDWYCELLGCMPEGEILHGHLYVLPIAGNTNLVLDSKMYSESAVHNHPLFHFNTDDIHAAYVYLQQKGVVLTTEIEHGHWFNCKDPDGNLLMICQC